MARTIIFDANAGGTPGRAAVTDNERNALARATASATRIVERCLFWLFVAALAWVPLYNGGDNLGAWGINAILFPGLAAIYEAVLLVGGKHHPVGIRHIAAPAGLFGAALAWGWAQTVAWPNSLFAHPVWRMAADALGTPLTGAISINPNATNLALLTLVSAAATFWTALQLCRDAVRANLLLKAIGAISLLYAAYGLLTLREPALRLPWLEHPAAAGMVSATFVNRDHYATYAGLGLLVTAGLALHLYRAEVAKRALDWRSTLSVAIEVIGRNGAWLTVAIIGIACALLLTASRGGALAAALGLFTLAVLTPRRSGLRIVRRGLLVGVVGLGIVGLLVVYGDPLVSGFRERGITDTTRMSVYFLTVQSIVDRPFLGHGYGTFSDIFAIYRDRSISVWGTWLQAHNTYLEVFQGLGLSFGSILLVGPALLVWHCVRGALTRRENSAVPGIAAATAVLVGVHALVDFSLQIQAITLTFMALLGAGVAQAYSSRIALGD